MPDRTLFSPERLHLLEQSPPLAEFVEELIDNHLTNSHSVRSYQTAFALFFQFLDERYGPQLSEPQASLWRPFVRADSDQRRKRIWTYQVPVGILWLVEPSDLTAFVNRMRHLGQKPGTIDNRIAALKLLFQGALDKGIIPYGQAYELTIFRTDQLRDKPEDKVGRQLSIEEVSILRRAVDTSTLRGKRDLAILDCMLHAALQRAEVSGLTVASLRINQGLPYLVLSGKNKKTRTIKIHPQLSDSLNQWRQVAKLPPHPPNQPLFGSFNIFGELQRNVNDTLVPLSRQSIADIVAEYGTKAGIAESNGQNRLTPHDLRRSWARIAYDNGAPLVLIKEILGHANIETTVHYIGAFTAKKSAIDFTPLFE